ncbi:MmpS family transport accessory protein [Nocardia fusca]|uniref:MmpS family transport accessory protein n=1 Tax=Nocardia fusca TaxID=941183 RepID=A0ABV3F4H3_9NOCA
MIEPPGEHRRRSGKSPSPAYRQDPYAGPAPAGRRSPHRRARWPWFAAGLVLMILCLVGGCVAVVAGIANEVGEDADREVAVSYEVEGTAGEVSVTYLGHDLGMARETAAGLPWRRDVLIDSFGTMVSLIAVNDADGGEVTCRILIGGRLVSEQTSTGPHASAGCSGNAGGG